MFTVSERSETVIIILYLLASCRIHQNKCFMALLINTMFMDIVWILTSMLEDLAMKIQLNLNFGLAKSIFLVCLKYCFGRNNSLFIWNPNLTHVLSANTQWKGLFLMISIRFFLCKAQKISQGEDSGYDYASIMAD